MIKRTENGKREKHTAFLRRALPLLCALMLLGPAALADRIFSPGSEAEAFSQAVSLFCHCAFHPEYGDEDTPGKLQRWESEITYWIGGTPTPEDRQTLATFLTELEAKVPDLPEIRKVSRDTDAALRFWFIPQHMMQYYLEDYVDGNWGFFRYDTVRNRITSARVAVAVDSTEQTDRNHLILEELVGALGLPGDHEVYSDSILYDLPSSVQTLSDVDWRMLNLLYSPSLAPGLTEQEALAILTGGV